MEKDPSEAIFDQQPPPLYETLGLERDASEQDIRKAYRRQALLYHPDKLTQDASDEQKHENESMFRKVSYAYTVLSHTERRKVFDSSGRTDESSLNPTEGTWEDYFKDLFDSVTLEKIDDFFDEYEDSEEERSDLFKAYKASDGSIEYIIEHVFCRDDSLGEERFTRIINKAIKDKELPKLSNWKENDAKGKSARKEKAKKEAQEAQELSKELGIDKELDSIKKSNNKETNKRKRKASDKDKGKEGEDDVDEEGLRALIKQRGENRMKGFLSSLAERYGADDYDETLDAPPPKGHNKSKKKEAAQDSKTAQNEKGKNKKAKKEEEPTDEEFEKIQARLMANQAKANKSK